MASDLNRITKTIKLSPKSAERCKVLAEQFGGHSHLIECLLTLPVEEVAEIVARAELVLDEEEGQRKAVRKALKSVSKMSDEDRARMALELKAMNDALENKEGK